MNVCFPGFVGVFKSPGKDQREMHIFLKVRPIKTLPLEQMAYLKMNLILLDPDIKYNDKKIC